jgi:hypothetical protein
MNASSVAWRRTLATAAACLITLHSGSLAVGPAWQTRGLLSNAAFERGLDGWRFEAWKDKVAKAVPDPQVPHGGRPSIRVDHPEVTDSSLTQIVKVKPNTRYRLSGWIKTHNVVKPELDYQRPGKEGASLGIVGGYEKSPSVTGTQNWTLVSMDFDSKSRTSVRIGPRLGHYGKKVTGTAWFADLSLVELGR